MTVGDARLRKLIDLWVERGCPEKLTIHVRSTGETIVLQEGVPVTIGERRGVQGPTTMFRTCATCRDVFPGHGRGLYCKSLSSAGGLSGPTPGDPGSSDRRAARPARRNAEPEAGESRRGGRLKGSRSVQGPRVRWRTEEQGTLPLAPADFGEGEGSYGDPSSEPLPAARALCSWLAAG